MAIIKATIDGEELEFEVVPKDDSGGIFGGCAKATHHLTDKGIVPLTIGTTYYMATLRLIRKQHTFGEFVFEETGETRRAVMGEWILETLRGTIMPTPGYVYGVEQTILEYIILVKPKEL